MEGSKDLKCAKETADYLKTVHTEVLFTPEEGFKAIPDIIRDLESYDITTIRASVGMWLLAKYISKNTDDIVLYSGEGADELFCGYLYFHYAPTPTDLANESERLIKELYWYDVLRADRCISSHGLELRVPFLDRNMVDLSMSTSGELLKPKDGLEKTLLRNAFTDNYLPDSIFLDKRMDFLMVYQETLARSGMSKFKILWMRRLLMKISGLMEEIFQVRRHTTTRGFLMGFFLIISQSLITGYPNG